MGGHESRARGIYDSEDEGPKAYFDVAGGECAGSGIGLEPGVDPDAVADGWRTV